MYIYASRWDLAFIPYEQLKTSVALEHNKYSSCRTDVAILDRFLNDLHIPQRGSDAYSDAANYNAKVESRVARCAPHLRCVRSLLAYLYAYKPSRLNSFCFTSVPSSSLTLLSGLSYILL